MQIFEADNYLRNQNIESIDLQQDDMELVTPHFLSGAPLPALYRPIEFNLTSTV